MKNGQQKRQMLLSGLILVLMLICAFLGWNPSRHAPAWHCGFYSLLLLHSLILYARTKDRPATDTLIRLFPNYTENAAGKTTNK